MLRIFPQYAFTFFLNLNYIFIYLFSSFLFSRINPEHTVQLKVSKADRWYNAAGAQLKSRGLGNKSMLFTQQHLSVPVPSVRACLLPGTGLPRLLVMQS